jgi:hypothetical protein
MKNIISLTILVAIIMVTAVTYILINQQEKSRAVDSCLQASSRVYKGATEEIKTPDPTWFSLCLQAKGMQVPELQK